MAVDIKLQWILKLMAVDIKWQWIVAVDSGSGY